MIVFTFAISFYLISALIPYILYNFISYLIKTSTLETSKKYIIDSLFFGFLLAPILKFGGHGGFAAMANSAYIITTVYSNTFTFSLWIVLSPFLFAVYKYVSSLNKNKFGIKNNNDSQLLNTNINRIAFLNEFLSAAGAKKIIYLDQNENSVSGTVYYNHSKPEEFQDFIWHMTEVNCPKGDVLLITKLLNKYDLIDGDKLKITLENLSSKFNNEYSLNYNYEKFVKIFLELEKVIINFVDDGEESPDGYIFHS